jgi:hypothetical protein
MKLTRKLLQMFIDANVIYFEEVYSIIIEL